MICSKCGKEIPNESEFCPYCGTNLKYNNSPKQEKAINEKIEDNKKEVKISLKKAIIISIIIIILLSIIGFGVYSYFSNKGNVFNNSTSKNQKYTTYELNKIGFFKNNENIIDEKYDEKNNLIYYKTTNNETNFNYEYDNTGKVTNINYTSNDFNGKESKSSMNITYNGEKIYTIKIDNELYSTDYIYEYNPDYTIVRKFFSSTSNIPQDNYSNEYNGAFIIINKIITNEEYDLVIELDKNGNATNKLVYKKDNNKNDNILSKISFAPMDYINTYYQNNCNITAGGMFTLSYPVTNQGNMIYRLNNGGSTKNTFDKENKILSHEAGDFIWYIKYDNVQEDNTFMGYVICDCGKNYEAYGAKSQYDTRKVKFYLNENNEVYKYDEYEEESISYEEFSKYKQEYLEYINNNKVDSDNIINEFNDILNTKDFNSYLESDEEDEIIEDYSNYYIYNNTYNNNYSNQITNNNKNLNNNSNTNYTEKTITTINRIGDSIGTNGREYVHSTLNGDYYIQGDIDFTTSVNWYEEAKKITVTVNGQNMKTRISEGTLVYEGIIKLVEGKQNITIVVNNPNGDNKTESFMINNTPNDYEISRDLN